MNQKSVAKFCTSAGRTIYSFPARAFPGLVANIYIVHDGEHYILVDTGSGREQSNQDLLNGLADIGETFGIALHLSDLDAILITHGHIDHFGGLPFIRRHSQAPIGVHPLDRRVLSHYEERVMVASRRLEAFLVSAGVSAENRADLMAMYLFAKDVYRSTTIQFTLEEGHSALDPTLMDNINLYHVPGHCPGQVCIQIDDILLTADHVLSRTTPHQSPESITNNMGLGHYLDSLDKIASLQGIRLALGGHEDEMPDLAGRVEEIKQAHRERLDDSRLGRFLDAVERGTQYLINHPQESWRLFVAADPDLDDELNRRAWRDTLPRFALRPAALDSARYRRFAAFLAERGLTGDPPPVEQYAVELDR